MKPFLKYVADYLLSDFSKGMEKVCIVFPNKRAALYLNKYLAEKMDRPVWAPRYSTISELMSEIGELTAGDPLVLQYELYKVYCEVHANPEPFEQFYSWGLTILSDFDDVDKYRVDASRLFQNLSDLKEIDERFDFLSDEQKDIIRSFWGNARLDKSSPLKQGFLNFWQELGHVYELFKEKLRGRKLAYEGMIYKEVAEKIKRGENIDLPFDAYCFVGFNALNECEKTLFDYFKKSGKARFFWDYDDYYIHNEWHEAGLFLRENIRRYPSPEYGFETSYFTARKKTINIIAANNDVAQAKILPKIIGPVRNDIKTCVVLSDESLLVPALSSLPESVERVNITMSYPFSNSPAFTLLDLVIRLMRSARKDREYGTLLYFKEVLALLRHPYLQQGYPTEANDIISALTKDNRIHIQPGELESIGSLYKLIKAKDTDVLEKLASLFLDLATTLDFIPSVDPLDIQYLLSLYSQTNKLLNLVRKENIAIPGVAQLRFLRMLAQRIKVSFIGEPLTDFQVLGVLETRLLDFDHVIMLSVNEGILPAKEQGTSFIPYNLRKALGMPTIEYHDSIYAYYFYRFIQRAQKVTLVYNAQSGNLRSGEMSRYLYQLKYDEHFEVKEKALTFQISVPGEAAIVVEKRDRIAELLKNFARNNTFTPTSLNTWLSCSLKFNFRFLEGLKEPDEVAEDVDASQFGKIFHHVMYLLYRSFEGNAIQKEDIQRIKTSDTIELAINDAFEKVYPSRGTQTWKLSGKNLIVKEILQKYIGKILEVDEEYAPFELVAIEKKIERTIEVSSVDFPVKIGGYVDRIDYKDGVYRIIDYKTGDATSNFKDIEVLFQGEKRKQKDAALQCLIYAYVLMEAFPEGAIQAGLYSVRKMFDKNYNYSLRITKGETISDIRVYKEEILSRLKEMLSNLLDVSSPFTKTNDLKACVSCAYKSICHR